MAESNSPEDWPTVSAEQAAAAEPKPTTRVVDRERHIVYDLTAALVSSPCGQRHPLREWLVDDPDLPWCGVCGFFADTPPGT